MKKIYLVLSFFAIAIAFTACDPDELPTPDDLYYDAVAEEAS